ncbi:hypothetical protein DRP04_03485 [Archaeoglobales archaeon]|nr:MAG: hypothetical protein DRP04_03485 [Archaeoglobales archaeon]
MSYLRCNYRITGGKINLAALATLANSGDAYISGATASRLIIFINNPLSASTGTYVAIAFSADAALSTGDL